MFWLWLALTSLGASVAAACGARATGRLCGRRPATRCRRGGHRSCRRRRNRNGWTRRCRAEDRRWSNRSRRRHRSRRALHSERLNRSNGHRSGDRWGGTLTSGRRYRRIYGDRLRRALHGCRRWHRRGPPARQCRAARRGIVVCRRIMRLDRGRVENRVPRIPGNSHLARPPVATHDNRCDSSGRCVRRRSTRRRGLLRAVGNRCGARQAAGGEGGLLANQRGRPCRCRGTHNGRRRSGRMSDGQRGALCVELLPARAVVASSRGSPYCNWPHTVARGGRKARKVRPAVGRRRIIGKPGSVSRSDQ